MGIDNLLCTLVQVYILMLFGRVILSWFPIGPGSALAGVYSFLYSVTEPILGPLRRVLPPLGGLDLSPIVAFFVIQLVAIPILCR